LQIPKLRAIPRDSYIRRARLTPDVPYDFTLNGETDKRANIFEKPDRYKKEVERNGRSSSTDPVHAGRMRPSSVAAYLHATVTSANDTSAQYFFLFSFRNAY
jgi:hypothetical protein